MKSDQLRVVGCRLVTGTARYVEFTLSDGQTVRVADPAKIDAIVAASDGQAPTDGAIAAFLLSERRAADQRRTAQLQTAQ